MCSLHGQWNAFTTHTRVRKAGKSKPGRDCAQVRQNGVPQRMIYLLLFLLFVLGFFLGGLFVFF